MLKVRGVSLRATRAVGTAISLLDLLGMCDMIIEVHSDGSGATASVRAPITVTFGYYIILFIEEGVVLDSNKSVSLILSCSCTRRACFLPVSASSLVLLPRNHRPHDLRRIRHLILLYVQ